MQLWSTLVCASLGPTALGLSELPGLPGSLFPLPDWGSSPSLCFQISVQFLAFLFFWHPYDLDVEMFKVVLEVPKPLLIFFEFSFLHSVQVECLFLPSAPNLWFETQFPSFHCWFPVYFYFTLHRLHFFLYFAGIFNHICEHPDYQCFELCIW